MDIGQMQVAFFKATFKRYELVAPNVFLKWDHEMDIVGVRKSGYVDEIEIKLSKSDFNADFKKRIRIKSRYPCIINEHNQYFGYPYRNKHTAMSNGESICNYFSFLLPADLVPKCTIPEYAGLYVASIDTVGILRVDEIKAAPRLHKRKLTDQKRWALGRKMAYRYWDSQKLTNDANMA